MKKVWSILFCVVLVLLSCKKQQENYINFHYDYYPTNVGHWVEYEVTDIVHNSIGSDTLTYFLKEEITGEFIDNEGEISQRIERYWKFDQADIYEIKDVWFGKITNTNAQKVEENQRYTKLIFPIKTGQYWDGNGLNGLNEWEYVYDSIHYSYELNNYSFDSTVKIIQRNNYNAVEYENCYELYAKDIGMIYKKHIDLSINMFNITDINEGVELEMELISFGE